MNHWTSAIFALIGVVIGGLISYLSNIHKTRVEKIWDRDRNILNKLEELYALVEEVQEGYFIAASYGALKTRHDKMPENLDKIPVAKMKMLIMLYAPEASNLIGEFDEKWDQFSNVYAQIITTDNLQASEIQTIYRHLFDSARDIANTCNQIQAQTLEIVKSLKVSRQK